MCSKGGKIKYAGMLLAVFVLFSTVAACMPPAGDQPPGERAPASPPQVTVPVDQGAAAQSTVNKDAAGSRGPLINLPVYYVKTTADDTYLVREVHQAPYTEEKIKASLEELIHAAPLTPDAAQVLPAATGIRSVTVRDGTATIDFSREVLRANVGAAGEAMGLQSIVNTITEYPEVQQVAILVEGKLDEEAKNWWGHVGLHEQPFTRDVSRVFEPAIWVTSPVPGQVVAPPLVITGSASVFEATVHARLRDEHGREIAQGFATAAEGAPGRGDFVLALDFPAGTPGKGQVEVFWPSPADGREIHKVIIPVAWQQVD